MEKNHDYKLDALMNIFWLKYVSAPVLTSYETNKANFTILFIANILTLMQKMRISIEDKW